MATNPMQRKARNSFLLGFVLAALIIGAVAGFLAYQLITMRKEKADLEATYKTVYILNHDVESGKTISLSDCRQTQITSLAIPQDYISPVDITEDTIAKVNLKAGTMLSGSVLAKTGEETSNDLRLQEYNMIILPSLLDADSYIDVRLTLPNGQDFIVLSKKRVIDANAETVWLNMSEEEILVMSNAIVESYIMTGSKLYATQYVEAGMQASSTPTYVPSGAVVDLINNNPNIPSIVISRYSDNFRQRRNQDIQSMLNLYSEKALDNTEKGIQEEVNKLKESRAQYFDSLNATTR